MSRSKTTGWGVIMTPFCDITETQANARIALADILACIRRRSKERHKHIAEFVETMDFFWLAETAGYDPHLTRIAFREELERVRCGGFGLKGKGRVGGGRKS